MPVKTHYPDYSVLSEEHEWDPHTREIVISRLGPFGGPKALSQAQITTLRAVLTRLIADDRRELLDYLVDHLDRQISSPIGQAERKLSVPPFSELLPQGLEEIEKHSQQHHGNSFDRITADQQDALLTAIEQGNLGKSAVWDQWHQRELFSQLLSQTVSAYYSHPWVWSEIGYAGPAYPRGYMRVELGLTEPWEAKRHGR